MPIIVSVENNVIKKELLILSSKYKRHFVDKINEQKIKFGSIFYEFKNQSYFVIYRVSTSNVIYSYWFLDEPFEKAGATSFIKDFYLDFLTNITHK